MTYLLASGKPFSYWRFGDGALETIYNRLGQSCDGERYRQDMGADILRAIGDLQQAPGDTLVYFGDWASAVNGSAPKYVDVWRELVKVPPDRLLHFEAVLLNRRTTELLDFYKAVKVDPRRKLIVGAEFNRPAGAMLGADYLAVPFVDLYQCIEHVAARIRAVHYDVLLFGAGLAGVIPIVDEWRRHPERTYIHMGSAFDPLFKGRTRSGQLSTYQARAFLREVIH